MVTFTQTVSSLKGTTPDEKTWADTINSAARKSQLDAKGGIETAIELVIDRIGKLPDSQQADAEQAWAPGHETIEYSCDGGAAD